MNLQVKHLYNTPVIKKNQVDDNYKFQPLPAPTGAYPFHLDVATILPAMSKEKMVFHMLGDTGSLRNPDFTRLVAHAMAAQYKGQQKDQPQFLYHLGDIVYNHGEASEYDRQFFIPYQPYPGPIFAIAGNHDSDVNPVATLPYHSLAAFTNVFCASSAGAVGFSRVSGRQSMVQPNIYWTMETPLATIIGLHSNVPKYGIVTAGQRTWFLEELVRADKLRPDKMLIVCLHHSPYSADVNHGSSLAMITFLETAFEETDVRPNIVFGGHVHNYQRFVKTHSDGNTTTYIVAGGGGYDELHSIAPLSDHQFTAASDLFTGVRLINYCDDKHGFLRIAIEKTGHGLQITGSYFSIAHEANTNTIPNAKLVEQFVVKA